MKNNIRILLVLKFLLEHSDQNHYVTIADINAELEKHNLISNRDTISDDIKELKSVGYKVECVRSTQNRYFINHRKFTTAEIKWLLDAVQSSRFIPQSYCRPLIDKLTAEAGEYQSEALQHQLYVECRHKSENEEISDTVEKLDQAISISKKVSFQYFDYNTKKERVLRHNGQIYTMSPFVLLWNNDQYYLIGHDDRHDGVSKYRLDRLTNLTVLNKKAEEKPADFNVSDFFEKEFSMLSGDSCPVELLCENKLMNSIVDKFGLQVDIETVDEEHFKVSTEVNLTGTFFGWVFASAGSMKIIGNDRAVAEFQKTLQHFTALP